MTIQSDYFFQKRPDPFLSRLSLRIHHFSEPSPHPTFYGYSKTMYLEAFGVDQEYVRDNIPRNRKAQGEARPR